MEPCENPGIVSDACAAGALVAAMAGWLFVLTAPTIGATASMVGAVIAAVIAFCLLLASDAVYYRRWNA